MATIDDKSVLQVLENGSFVSLQPNAPDAQDFLIGTPLDVNQPWNDFLAAFNFLMEQNVEGPIEQLESLRFISRDTDGEVLVQTGKMLGFNLNSEIYKLSETKILNIVSQLPMYAENASNEGWSKFLDFVLNGNSKIDYLWTKDYQKFYTKPQGVTIERGGQWFKTTHIHLSLQMLADQPAVTAAFAGDSRTVAQRLQEIIYEFAPITLVIKSLILVHEFPIKIPFGGQLLSYIHEDVTVS